MSKPNPAEGYFLYQDASGQLFIADTLEGIPEAYRGMAKRLSLDEAKAVASKVGSTAQGAKETAVRAKKEAVQQAQHLQREVGDVLPFVKSLDLPSVAVGFSFALGVVLVYAVIKRTGAWVFKLGLLLAVAMLFGGAYFGWLRKAAGLSEDSMGTPTQLIQDAKDVADQAKAKLKSEEKMLKKIEEGAP